MQSCHAYMSNLILYCELVSQVFLTGLISFATTFIIMGYVVLKFNKHSWDLESCLLFSMALGITDPIYSVNSLKTIGMLDLFLSLILKI